MIMATVASVGDVWRIRIPKLNLDLVPKSYKKHSKPGSLEGQGPKSKISKINFTSWIRGFCRHLYTFVSSFFLKDQDPKTESRFSPKIMQIRCKAGSLKDQDPKSKISKINFASWIKGFCRHLYIFVSSFFLKDQDPKTESRFSPKIMQIRCKEGSLKDQDPKRKISKINFASWIKGFCRHLSHLFFLF